VIKGINVPLVFMAKKQKSPDRSEIRSITLEVLKEWGTNAEVCAHVKALIGSLDDTLEDEFVLRELKALKASGMPFQEVFASIGK
jgi:hypothetical protein